MQPNIFRVITCSWRKWSFLTSSLASGSLEEGKKRESAVKMGMTSGHAIAAITIGTLQSLFSVILIITSFVLLSYGHGVKTSITPYWSGFPVSVERFRSVYLQICGVD